MKIYIPTLGRVDNQVTWNTLPDKWRERVVFVVQEHERPKYKFDTEYLTVPDKCGIARTRRDLIKHAGKTHFAMYDDDIMMHTRAPNYKELGCKSKVPFVDSDWDDWFDTALGWLEEPKMMQIGPKGADLPPKWDANQYIDIGPPFCASVINGRRLQQVFDVIPWTLCESGEDSMMILSYLSRGYRNRLSQRFTFLTKFYAAGGLETDGRSVERELADYQRLIDLFPEFAKWGKPSKIHPGSKRMSIQWKKAWKSSQISKLHL